MTKNIIFVIIVLMILVSHGIIGGAIGSFFPQNPLLAFFMGLLSHFIFDAIPHWHYQVKSISSKADSPKGVFKIGWGLALDSFKICLDFFLGFLLAMLIFGKGDYSNYSVFAGTLGGVFPDAIMLLSFVWRNKIVLAFQKFHFFIHTDIYLDSHPVFGPLTQAVIVSAVVALAKILV
jgi:hypothetical protein